MTRGDSRRDRYVYLGMKQVEARGVNTGDDPSRLCQLEGKHIYSPTSSLVSCRV